jgi:hypothetical protein
MRSSLVVFVSGRLPEVDTASLLSISSFRYGGGGGGCGKEWHWGCETGLASMRMAVLMGVSSRAASVDLVW